MHRNVTAGLGLVLLSGLLGLGGCTTPPPEAIRVTTTADVVADDDVTSLREAFEWANRAPNDNLIELVAGEPGSEYLLTDCTAGPLVHTTASKVTVVVGGVIRQTCPDTGIMASTEPASALSLVGLTLIGGPNTGVTVPGAGLNVRGSLLLANATVTGVDAGPGGTVVDGNDGGPADRDIVLEMSDITGNTGTGVSIRDGVVELSFSYINGNTGDGLRLLGDSTYDASYAYVEHNTGWGLDVRGTGASVVRTQDSGVQGNGGGGISCTGCIHLYLSESFVMDNGADAAEGSGGGIVFTAVAGPTFEDLTVGVYYGRISGNQARRAGGGLFVEGPAPGPFGPSVRVYDSAITGNSTVGDGHHGGGIAITAGEFIGGGNTISDNVAGGSGSDGGGVYFAVPTGEYDFEANTFGSYGDVISGNRAGGDGGAIAVDTVDGVTMTGSDIVGNVAAGTGGGARIVGDAVLDRMHFRNNLSTLGGGVFVSAPDRSTDVTVTGSTFETNTSSGRGGGLAANGVRSLHVVNATVVGNVAVGPGGGIAVLDDPPGGSEELYLHFSTLTGNSAALGANVASEVRLETYGAVLAEPQGGGTNCAVDPGDRFPWGYSFVSDVSCGSHPLDVVSAEDPQLGPLTADPDPDIPPTRTPAPTSPIAGMVPVAACDVDADQRWTTRPQGGACEAGSVEIVETVAGRPLASLARR